MSIILTDLSRASALGNSLTDAPSRRGLTLLVDPKWSPSAGQTPYERLIKNKSGSGTGALGPHSLGAPDACHP